MTNNRFTALPSKWIRDGKLIDFAGHQKPGESIAALKCLIAINSFMDYDTKKTEISISDLERLTTLSRPSVINGIKKLEFLKIIKISSGIGIKNQYDFTYDNAGWAKLPVEYALRLIAGISNRRLSSLAALKIYLTLLSFRQNNTDYCQIKQSTLRSYTGIQNRDIKVGYQILIEQRVICVYQEIYENKKGYTANKYQIKGIYLKHT